MQTPQRIDLIPQSDPTFPEVGLGLRDVSGEAYRQLALSELALRAVREPDLAALFNEAAHVLVEVLGVEYASVLELRAVGDELWTVGAAGGGPTWMTRRVAAGSESAAGYALLSHDIVLSNDLSRESRFAVPASLTEHEIHSSLTVVIHGRDRPWGALGAYASRRNAFSVDEAHFAQTVANLLAQAIERWQTDRALRVSDVALRRAQGQLTHVLSSSPVVLYCLQIEGDQVRPTWVSENITQVTGHSRDAALRPTWWVEHVHPDDLSAFAHAGVLLKQEHMIHEYRFRRADDSYFWIRDEQRVLFDPNGSTGEVVGSWSDITEQRRTAESLEQSARLARLGRDVGVALTKGADLNTILRACSDAVVQHLDAAFARIWTFNGSENVLELQASSGLYTHINGAHSRIPLGALKIGLIGSKKEPHLTNQVIGDPLVGDQEWALREGMVAFAGYPLVVEDRLVGVIAMFARQALSEATIDALASIANEIAVGIERIRVDQALKMTREHLEEVISLSPAVLYRIKVKDERFAGAWVSDNVLRVTGFEAAEVLAPGWYPKHVHPDDLSRLNLSAASLRPHSVEEYRVLRRDGTYVWVRDESRVVYDSLGAALEVIGSCADITEAKKAEETVRVANDPGVSPARTGPGRETILITIAAVIGFLWVYFNPTAEDALESNIRFLDEFLVVFLFGLLGFSVLILRQRAQMLMEGRQRKSVEVALRTLHSELDLRVQKATAILAATNDTLRSEIEGRRRVEQDLRRRLQFEEVINRLSNRFTDSDPVAINLGIDEALAAIGDLANVDRTSVFLLSQDGKSISNTNRWDSTGRPSEHESLQQLPIEAFPWWATTLSRGESFQVRAVDDLPVDAGIGKQILQARGLRSMLAIPISTGQGTIGFVALTTVHTERIWSPESMVLLRLMTDMLGRALERQRNMRELIDSEQRYRQLAETTEDMIVLHDLDGRIEYANRACGQILGYEVSDLMTKRIDELVVEEEREALHQRSESRRMPDTARYHYEIDALSKDGQRIPVAVSSSLFMRDDVPTSVLLVVRDIRDARKLQQQFLQAQKMEAIGRLAGGVAHDFNNQLFVINGYCEMIQQRCASDDTLRGWIEEVQGAAGSAAELTQQLLTFSRRQVVDPKVIDLNSAVAGMEKMLRRLIGEDVSLEIQLGLAGSVKADPGQLGQIIMNLAVNARDAMPSGGKLLIESRKIELDNLYSQTHPDVAAGVYAMLSVVDSGVGMDEETLSRIYEPFFTTKDLGKGTGLGLSTVYGIVAQHGGHINVYSEPGHGTVVNVYLPQAEPAREQLQQAARPSLERRGSETILLVEDEGALRNLLAEALRQNGYQVLEGVDGMDGLDVARQFPGEISLAITDVIMPRMSGRDFAIQVQAERPEIEVLYMSGYAENVIAHQGILDPGLAFIQKPAPLGLVLERIRTMLDSE